MLNRRHWIGAALCSPWLSGYADVEPASEPGADVERPPAGGTVLSLHLRANEAAYRKADDEARQQIEAALAGAGYRVARVDPSDYQAGLSRRLSDPALQGLPISDRRVIQAEADVLSAVARVGCQAVAGAMLVRTRLRLRPASMMEQGVVTWDGVRRVLDVSTSRVMQRLRHAGQVDGISLEAIGVRADGRIAWQRHGGIALPFRMHVDARGAAELHALDNPFKDPGWLSEGIALALAALQPR